MSVCRERPKISRASFRGFLAFLLLTAVSAVALAATYSYSATHVTEKSPEHVFRVLTAYDQICDEGCKYEGPGVVKFLKVLEYQSDKSWYTWTHVKSGLKHTKYFNHVRVLSRSDSGFKMVTRQLEERDKAMITKLEKRTGLAHNPVFDTGKTTFTVKKLKNGKTSVTQSMRLTGTGMVTMFRKKIEAGLREGAQATFANIEK